MKTKITSASGHDAYEMGYLVGSKQLTIRDFCVVDWESDYYFYRRGYNAGIQRWYQQNKRKTKRTKNENSRA